MPGKSLQHRLHALADQAERDRKASEAALAELQARLPGPDWKERHGAAGVGKHQKRGSPMVELSLILVRSRRHTVPLRSANCCLHCLCLKVARRIRCVWRVCGNCFSALRWHSGLFGHSST